MTTEEGNRLIAEFMGWKLDKDRFKGCWFNTYGVRKTDKLNPLRFDLDWEWLMPVVEKIEGMNFINNDTEYSFDVVILYHDCQIRDEDEVQKAFYLYEHGDSKIEATWKAIVKFIEWYNIKKIL